MLKRTVTAVAKRLGYTIIPTWRLDTFAADSHLARLFALLSVDLVLDVGANVGQFRDGLRRHVGYRGPIVSFEPIPRVAGALAQRAQTDPLWTVDARALGAAAGEAEFNVMENTVFSSMLQPRGGESGLEDDGNRVADRIRVEVATLKDVLPPLIARTGAKSVFLKIDTQGFDLAALQGAGSDLSLIAALQFEASLAPIYEGAPRFQEIMDYAAAHGFVASNVHPMNPGHFPRLLEFDCCMIHRDRVRAAAVAA